MTRQLPSTTRIMAYQLDMTTARFFVSVVEEGSIAGAARRESIVPSAISKRISELEQRLGHVLLERYVTGVEMTLAGSMVLRRSRNMINEARQLEAELNQLTAGAQGYIRIAASETTLVGYLPEVLGEFMQAHPGVRADVDERVNAEVVSSVERHEADLGIYAGDMQPGGLWVRPCYRDQIVAVMRHDHELASFPGVTLAELLNHEIIGQGEGGALGSLLDRQAAAQGRSIHIRVRARNWGLACRLAQQGLGIGIVAESSSLLFAEAMGLVTLPVLESWARREHRVCVRNPEELSNAAKLLLGHILRRAGMEGSDISKEDGSISNNQFSSGKPRS
jgi:DNA-binding transcriptional LysR family regulator